MTEVIDAVKTLLSADATLTGYLTGGIYTRHELGKAGLKEGNPSAAWAINDGLKELQPCLVVNIRSNTPDGERADVPSQTVSVTSTLELWFYDDDSYSTINQARNRCYALLHWKGHAGIGFTELIYRMTFYDESLNDAATYKDDYKLKYKLIGA
jgi:hypothetical protein